MNLSSPIWRCSRELLHKQVKLNRNEKHIIWMNALATYSLCRFEIKSWWKCWAESVGEGGAELVVKIQKEKGSKKVFISHAKRLGRWNGANKYRKMEKREAKLFVWMPKHMSMKIMLYELFRKFVSSLLESFSLNVDEKLFTHPSSLLVMISKSSFSRSSNEISISWKILIVWIASLAL